MYPTARRLAGFIVIGAALMLPRAAVAQTTTFEACTTALVDCAFIRLTNQAGLGTGGENLFTIAIQNLGSSTDTHEATSILDLILAAGPSTNSPEVDLTAAPTAEGGASLVSSPPAWMVTLSSDPVFGDVIALVSPDNSGIGGCVSGLPTAAFTQVGQTCPNQFISFSFSTARTYDPTALTVSELDFVDASSSDGNPADGCGSALVPCTTTLLTTATPEPATVLLSLTGFAAVAVVRRRRQSAFSHRVAGEA